MNPPVAAAVSMIANARARYLTNQRGIAVCAVAGSAGRGFFLDFFRWNLLRVGGSEHKGADGEEGGGEFHDWAVLGADHLAEMLER